MEYTVLKGTGIKVSKACVGTMTFGGQMDEKAACQAVDYAIEQGVNFFDTANLYYTGESERILGKALLGKRQDMIVTTKVSFPMSGCLNHEGLSRVNILRCVEESLKRLQTDYIDIYFLHKPDHTTPLEESLQAMDMLVRQGKVRYIGLSNYSAWKTCDALHICKEQNMVAPSVTEMVYNMLTRTIEPEYVPMLKEKRLGLMIYNPLAGGLLTGRHLPGHEEADSRFTQPAFKAYPQRYLTRKTLTRLQT